MGNRARGVETEARARTLGRWEEESEALDEDDAMAVRVRWRERRQRPELCFPHTRRVFFFSDFSLSFGAKRQRMERVSLYT